ncbi:hypothetical protein ABER68_04160 [Paenibacillus alvei]
MLTGLMTFQNKKCVFKLKDYILEIEEIESESRDDIRLSDLFFPDDTWKSNLPKVLVGKDLGSGNTMHFKYYYIYKSGVKSYCASLSSYIIFKNEETKFDGLKINSEELNWFHNVKQSYSIKTYLDDSGNSEIKIEPYKSTDKRFVFNFKGQDVEVNLNISRYFSDVSTMPIKLHTDLNFFFEITDKFEMLEGLSNVAFKFLKFVTYRRNIAFNNLALLKKDEDTTKYETVGTLYIKGFNTERDEEEKVITERLIHLKLIENNMGKLFEELTNNKIYIDHIPENSLAKNIITPASIIMVTAGFEWQFRLTYKELSKENEDTFSKQKEEILAFLDGKINQNTGRVKRYFKSSKALIQRNDMNLAGKIRWALTEFKDEIDIFIKPLYNWDEVSKSKLSEIAERLQTQRNNVAHGNIDKEFNRIVMSDLVVLEWLYYIMVLHNLGVPKANVKSAVNKLFNRRLAL